MNKTLFTFCIALTLGIVVGVGFASLHLLERMVGWPSIPESGWNDHYDGKSWKVVKSVPAHEIVDQDKLKECGGEEVYFFAKNGSAYPTNQEVHCVILRSWPQQ